MLTILITILWLLTPTLAEAINDWNGEDLRDKRQDVYMRIYLILFVPFSLLPDLVGYSKAIALETALFILTFDYLMNIILKRTPWFSYLGSGPIDQFWIKLNPWFRFGIRVALFIAALLYYYV